MIKIKDSNRGIIIMEQLRKNREFQLVGMLNKNPPK